MWKIPGAILVMVVVISLIVTACQAEPASAPQVDMLAPDFKLESLSGQVVSLSGLRGSPVVLNFWATWCGPCRMEMPYIQELYEESSGSNLTILTINIAESPSQVQEFMGQNGLSFTVLFDKDGAVAGLYEVHGIPTTIFIDSEGVIRVMKVGAFPSKAAIERDLSKIISGQ